MRKHDKQATDIIYQDNGQALQSKSAMAFGEVLRI
jgi:hypothetical protein